MIPEMVKRSRRDDLQSTNFNQMTTSNITASANNNTGFKALVGTVLVSVLLPFGLVLGATVMNADSAEAYSSTTCTRIGNIVTCSSY